MKKFISINLLVFYFLGCGSVRDSVTPIEPHVTASEKGVATLLVSDSMIEVVSGCLGITPGQAFKVGEELACQLTHPDAKVFFLFYGSQLQHQILSQGGLRFVSSPLIMPSQVNPLHVVQINVAGTYEFQEVTTGITGRLIVPSSEIN